jgi:hypothetical protein
MRHWCFDLTPLLRFFISDGYLPVATETEADH